jgi:hypothetical protein
MLTYKLLESHVEISAKSRVSFKSKRTAVLNYNNIQQVIEARFK